MIQFWTNPGSDQSGPGLNRAVGSVCVCVWASVHVYGVKDPLSELLQFGRGAVRLLQEALVVLPQALDLDLQGRLGLFLLMKTHIDYETVHFHSTRREYEVHKTQL